MAKIISDTGHPAIRIEGGLLSASVLTSLRQFKLPGQKSEEYGVEKGLKLSDELGRYWRIAQARWEQFKDLSSREDQDSHKITVEQWLLPLFTKVFDFEIAGVGPISINERQFPITHMAFNKAVPFVLTKPEHLLDKGAVAFGEEGRKRSPAGLAQEYLNAEDNCLWAIVSNGYTLRLLRDNPALTRPAYIEINLEQIFEEELYVDFTLTWLLLHETRFSPQESRIEKCFLEQWREQGQDDGERVLGELSHGVTEALRLLGTGFVTHPQNSDFRKQVQEGTLTTDLFFQELLRLIYRFLFLLTTEDRGVLLDPDADVRQQKVYRDGYSLDNLRERSRYRRYWDSYDDAWQQLLITFEGFSEGQPLLAQPALGGLFAKDQCSHLESTLIDNRYLYSAIFKLCFFENKGVLTRINYRDMDTEELGSVYESLLELIPKVRVDGQWHFSFLGDEEGEGDAAGHTRKLTGSYYTPDSLVQELIKSALEPVIEDRLATNKSDPRGALLGITVCDPACGSGHFLLAAARRLAAGLAQVEAGADQPTEADYRHALREVIGHCIYGVDVNPLAVELCRTALWLEAVEPGKPLSFLDHHIQCGNSVLGTTPALLKKGIPDEAFKAIEGDVQTCCTAWRIQNKGERAGVRKLWSHEGKPSWQTIEGIARNVQSLDAIDDSSIEGIKKKREKYKKLIESDEFEKNKLVCDAWCAAFVIKKDDSEELPYVITEEVFRKIESSPNSTPASILDEICALSEMYNFFHWHLEFPNIFRLASEGDLPENELTGLNGGFDVILGNPPWERVKLQEKEFFAGKDDFVSSANNKSARVKAIKALEERNPGLFKEFQNAKRTAQGISNLLRESGRYPLCGRGDVNLYAVFAELNRALMGAQGYAGFIIQSDIATGDTYKLFFEDLLQKRQLISFHDFQNKERLFAGLDTRNPHFCLVTLSSIRIKHRASFSFWNTNPTHLLDHERRFTISFDELSLLNPNTKTCPVFKNKKDSELALYIYKRFPVLVNDILNENPWEISFNRMFDMANSSNLFRTKKNLLETGNELIGNIFREKTGGATIEYLPLYEAKMIHQYNHRFGDYANHPPTSKSNKLPPASNEQLKDPFFTVTPKYWVNSNDVKDRLPFQVSTLFGWRDITNARNERTVIASAIPVYGVGDKFLLYFCKGGNEGNLLVLSILNSLILDFIARQKFIGTSFKYYLMKQLPVPRPEKFDEKCAFLGGGKRFKDFIIPRVLELVRTSVDMDGIASGEIRLDKSKYEWDEKRRYDVRCEIDAILFYIYLGGESGWGDLMPNSLSDLFSTKLDAVEYVLDSFEILKNNETKKHGRFLYKERVLSIYESMMYAMSNNTVYNADV